MEIFKISRSFKNSSVTSQFSIATPPSIESSCVEMQITAAFLHQFTKLLHSHLLSNNLVDIHKLLVQYDYTYLLESNKFTIITSMNRISIRFLLHHRPDLIEYQRLRKDANEANLQSAFHVADERLGIRSLLDVQGMCDALSAGVPRVLSHPFSRSPLIGQLRDCSTVSYAAMSLAPPSI